MKLLDVLSINEVRSIIDEYLKQTRKKITIELQDSLNYMIATDILATENIPAFNKSTVDGYAVQSIDVQVASQSIPAVLKKKDSIPIGVENNQVLGSRECVYINTGAMLPVNADAIVMIEDTEYNQNTNDVLIFKGLSKYENVTLCGSDIHKDSLVFSKGTLISERVIAVLASLGITKLDVYQKPTCLIISSGNELVDYHEDIKMAQVRDVNTVLLKTELEKNGFIVKDTILIKDEYNEYLNVLQNNEVDIYITSGGSSKGNEDYTYDVFNQITNNVVCHGLAIKPGKPTIIAKDKFKLYIGLPGNPVSAFLVLKETLLACYLDNTFSIKARLKHNIQGSAGRDSLILIELQKDNNEYFATPIYYRSSQLLNLAQADGYFIIDKNVEGINKDEIVEVHLL